MFVPKSVVCFREGYTREALTRDVIAGNVPAVDATGIHALEQLALKCKSQGTMLVLAEVREQPRSVLARAARFDLFANRVTTLDEALDRAGE